MSDTVKLVIEIPKIDKELLDTGSCGESRKEAILFAVKYGTPLSEVLAEIKEDVAEEVCLTDNPYTRETKFTIEHLKLLEILDNIGKAESEDK